MKSRLGIALLAVTCCLSAQQIDLSSLDKLASKAKSFNKISLNHEQLASALSMLSSSDGEDKKNLNKLKELTQNLTEVEVRNFEFAKKGQYRDTDLADVRTQITEITKSKDWSKIIDSSEDGEHSEVFMSSAEGHKGLIIIAAEATEVSVVILKGPQSLGDLGKLGGVLGLPSMSLGPAKKDE